MSIKERFAQIVQEYTPIKMNTNVTVTDGHYKKAYEALQLQVTDLREDLQIARAKMVENPEAVWQIGSARDSKIDRQKKALRELNRRVRVQRLQLRRLNELERGLRPEEWRALKEEFAHELAEDDWDLED